MSEVKTWVRVRRQKTKIKGIYDYAVYRRLEVVRVFRDLAAAVKYAREIDPTVKKK